MSTAMNDKRCKFTAFLNEKSFFYFYIIKRFRCNDTSGILRSCCWRLSSRGRIWLSQHFPVTSTAQKTEFSKCDQIRRKFLFSAVEEQGFFAFKNFVINEKASYNHGQNI